jgi:hypothetical protein
LALVLAVHLSGGVVGELPLRQGLAEQLLRRIVASRDRGELRLVVGVVLALVEVLKRRLVGVAVLAQALVGELGAEVDSSCVNRGSRREAACP